MKLKNKCDLFVRLSAIGRAFLRIIALRDPGVCVVVSVEGWWSLLSSEEVFSKKKMLKEFPYKSAQKKGKHKVCFETLNPKMGGLFSLSLLYYS